MKPLPILVERKIGQAVIVRVLNDQFGTDDWSFGW